MCGKSAKKAKASQKQLDTKLEILKFDNVEDGWTNFRKIVYEVADGVLRMKIRNIRRKITII